MKDEDCTAATEDREPKRLSGPKRRAQLLRIASAQFAMTGLRATTTVDLAKAAGISESILYDHFTSKEFLFREAVENNIEARLQALDARLAATAGETGMDCIESMAEATVAVCLSSAGSALLTNWALLEDPGFAAEIHRNEIGSVWTMWERELMRPFPDSRSRLILSMTVIPYAVHACLAYGFWLAMVRHTEESAAALTRQFAAGIAEAACSALRSVGDVHE